jgi:hypothetical protein
VTDRQTDGQTDRKWVPTWRAGDEWPVLIPNLLAIARSWITKPPLLLDASNNGGFVTSCALPRSLIFGRFISTQESEKAGNSKVAIAASHAHIFEQHVNGRCCKNHPNILRSSFCTSAEEVFFDM